MGCPLLKRCHWNAMCAAHPPPMKNATRTLRNVKHLLTCAWPSSTLSVTQECTDDLNGPNGNGGFFCLCPGSAKSIVKQCASQDTCNSASSSVDANGDGNTINCCNTHDLCNFSRAKSFHTRTSLLLSTAGALLLLSHWGRSPSTRCRDVWLIYGIRFYLSIHAGMSCKILPTYKRLAH